MMKRFESRELRQAIAHALAGGQALHIHRIISDWRRAPQCFRAAIRRGESIAHLFDQDPDRLVATAREFGVKVIRVEHWGRSSQHIDLCGVPLLKAEFFCDDPDEYHTRFNRGNHA